MRISKGHKKLNHALLSVTLFISLSYPLLAAGPEKHIERSLRQYGQDIEQIMEQSQRLQDETLGDVADFLDNPEDSSEPASSFYGSSSRHSPDNSKPLTLREVFTPPSSAESCGSCQTRTSASSLQKTVAAQQSQSSSSFVSKSNPSGKDSPSSKPLLNNKISHQTMAFVSLSMPESALKQLGESAQAHSVRLVIQGLKQNSWKITADYLQNLNIPVDIDPTLFETFEIKRVPTFIRCRVQNGETLVKDHDRLMGNVPLEYVLEKFDQEGEA